MYINTEDAYPTQVPIHSLYQVLFPQARHVAKLLNTVGAVTFENMWSRRIDTSSGCYLTERPSSAVQSFKPGVECGFANELN